MILALTDAPPEDVADFAASYLEVAKSPSMVWHLFEAEREHLWQAQVRSAQRGERVFRGVPTGGQDAVAIAAALLRGSKPDFRADTLEAGGTVYRGVGVFPGSFGDAGDCHLRTKDKGGAPNRYDWQSFQRELVRALFEGGMPDRRSIKKHMLDWCVASWPQCPDDKRIREKLNEYWHPDIPDLARRK